LKPRGQESELALRGPLPIDMMTAGNKKTKKKPNKPGRQIANGNSQIEIRKNKEQKLNDSMTNKAEQPFEIVKEGMFSLNDHSQSNEVSKTSQKRKIGQGVWKQRINNFDLTIGMPAANLPVNTAGLKSGSPLPLQTDTKTNKFLSKRTNYGDVFAGSNLKKKMR
jgi:hypothetical protein